jgi:hypothetical protein
MSWCCVFGLGAHVLYRRGREERCPARLPGNRPIEGSERRHGHMHAATSWAWAWAWAWLCCEGDRGGAATSGLPGRPATWIPRSTGSRRAGAVGSGGSPWGRRARQPLEGYTHHIYSVHITYNYVYTLGGFPLANEYNHDMHIYLI